MQVVNGTINMKNPAQKNATGNAMKMRNSSHTIIHKIFDESEEPEPIMDYN